MKTIKDRMRSCGRKKLRTITVSLYTTVFENRSKKSHFTTLKVRAKQATFIYKLTYLNFRAKNPIVRIIKLGTIFDVGKFK